MTFEFKSELELYDGLEKAQGYCPKCAATIPNAEAKNSNPTVLPPTSKQYEKYTSQWWQWAASIPDNMNPVLDSTGEYCDVNQSGHVWFLAGTTDGIAERDCSIPTGKQILIPIVNYMWFDIGSEEAENNGSETIQFLGDLIQGKLVDTNFTPIPLVVIDGVALSDLHSYRFDNLNAREVDCQSSLCNPLDATHGIDGGFYIMLTPLTPGEHTIQFQALTLA